MASYSLLTYFSGQDQSSDIVFAFGLTGTNLKDDAEIARTVSMEITNQMKESDKISIGSVRMEDIPVTLFDLTSTKRKSDILSRLKSAKLSSASFDVRDSLSYISANVFKLDDGDRFQIPKTLVIFVNQPQNAIISQDINALLEQNVQIIVVGVGERVTEAYLLVLVNGNRDMIRLIPTLNDLSQLIKIEVVAKPCKFFRSFLILIQCVESIH